MSKIINEIKETRWTFLGTTKLLMNWLLIVAVALFAMFMIFAPAYSAFTAGLLKISVSIYVFYLFDRFALKTIDTIEELKKGNIAYAIFLFAIAILIAIAMQSI